MHRRQLPAVCFIGPGSKESLLRDDGTRSKAVRTTSPTEAINPDGPQSCGINRISHGLALSQKLSMGMGALRATCKDREREDRVPYPVSDV